MSHVRIFFYSLIFLVAFAIPASLFSETVKDREGSVRQDRSAMEKNTRWIYNDIDEGFRQAKESGKPLMVVLRCVPCLACMGIDTGILIENKKLTPLMDQFVRVRVINANALDLSKFQFDTDLSFSTLFFNADGTVYGRYGSWEHQKDSQNQATDTFRLALEGALGIHANYPSNRVSLTGKQGKMLPWKTPVDMPKLNEKYRSELDWGGKVVKSCVHCHMIGDALRFTARESNQGMPLDLIYSYPAPETIGITMEKNRVNSIAKISPDSSAAQAGLKNDDIIESLAGQSLISSADFSWVLHNSPDSGSVIAGVIRNETKMKITIPLPDGWRAKSDISRRVGTWPMRAMAFGGMFLIEMTDAEKNAHQIKAENLALFAKHVGQYGKHAAAKKQGFKKGDIITAIDGNSTRLTESELLGQLIREHHPGEKVPATVLRGKKELQLQIPIQ